MTKGRDESRKDEERTYLLLEQRGVVCSGISIYSPDPSPGCPSSPPFEKHRKDAKALRGNIFRACRVPSGLSKLDTRRAGGEVTAVRAVGKGLRFGSHVPRTIPPVNVLTSAEVFGYFVVCLL